MPTSRSPKFHAADMKSFGKLPLALAQNRGIWPAPKHQHALIACVRWQAGSVAEWLSYHRSIGFDHVYLYCNDEDPSALYQAIMPFLSGANPFVTFRHYRYPGARAQIFHHFLRHYVQETRWLMFLDLDEFVCLPGSNDIRTVTDRFGANHDAIYLNRCTYGRNNDAEDDAGSLRSVLNGHRYRENGVSPVTKVLAKASAIPYRLSFENPEVAIDRDLLALGMPLRACNMLGESVADYTVDFPEKAWSILNEDDRRNRLLQAGHVAFFNKGPELSPARRQAYGFHGDVTSDAYPAHARDQVLNSYHTDSHAVFDPYLSDYWTSLVQKGRESTIIPCSPWPLISVGKSAIQSSTIHDRPRDEDACCAISGQLTGRPQSHTAQEDYPWWMIDLGTLNHIHEIMIFNRVDGVEGGISNFIVEVSHDRFFWRRIIDHQHGEAFGGLDGTPFDWYDEKGVLGRFVRIIVLVPQATLQMDQVEIYGLPYISQEDNPWHVVDLDSVHQIHEIVMTDRRIGMMERLSGVVVEVSHDQLSWSRFIDRQYGAVFSGPNSATFTWRDETGVCGRFLRITIPGTQVYLQADQIRIHGRPYPLIGSEEIRELRPAEITRSVPHTMLSPVEELA